MYRVSQVPSSDGHLRYEVELSFRQAALGYECKIELPPGARCSACSRSMVKALCTSCQGTGVAREASFVTVSSPPGVDSGTTLRLGAMGLRPQGRTAHGDVYVVIRVQSDPVFQRRGRDLRCELEIDPAVARDGGQVELPTLEGPVQHAVKKGTKDGTRIVLEGRGIPALRGKGRGDLEVTLKVREAATHSLDRRLQDPVGIFDDDFTTLLPRGTPLPAQVSESFSTAFEGQDAFPLRIAKLTGLGVERLCETRLRVPQKAGEPRFTVILTLRVDEEERLWCRTTMVESAEVRDFGPFPLSAPGSEASPPSRVERPGWLDRLKAVFGE